MERKVVTRFAPSPTGHLHMGGVRTALFAYLFARQRDGAFILRIEDTDKERSRKEFDESIVDSMKWLALPYDALYRQSERAAIYKKHLERLLGEGKAYLSKEAAGEGKRSEVLRFKNPNRRVRFRDLIRGEIEFDTAELGDFVIAKSLDEPVYHFAAVADDFEMGITHVIRGEDHISNTPRQILIQEALRAPEPLYAHVPLVLAPDRSKLSKRKHGEAVSIEYYRKQGYLPEAILNFLALLGWNPGGNEEIFSMNDLLRLFDLSSIQKGSAVFNTEKLDWINKEHLKRTRGAAALTAAEILKTFPAGGNADKKLIAEKIAPLVLERISKFGDIAAMQERGELGYFFAPPSYSAQLLRGKTETEPARIRDRLAAVAALLEKIPNDKFAKDGVRSAVFPYAEKEGRGEVLWPFRAALSGQEKSPDPFTIAEIIGKENTLARLRRAIQLLS